MVTLINDGFRKILIRIMIGFFVNFAKIGICAHATVVARCGPQINLLREKFYKFATLKTNIRSLLLLSMYSDRSSEECLSAENNNRPTDRPTVRPTDRSFDRPTDQPTD